MKTKGGKGGGKKGKDVKGDDKIQSDNDFAMAKSWCFQKVNAPQAIVTFAIKFSEAFYQN